jgi:hypothetical protein
MFLILSTVLLCCLLFSFVAAPALQHVEIRTATAVSVFLHKIFMRDLWREACVCGNDLIRGFPLSIRKEAAILRVQKPLVFKTLTRSQPILRPVMCVFVCVSQHHQQRCSYAFHQKRVCGVYKIHFGWCISETGLSLANDRRPPFEGSVCQCLYLSTYEPRV